MTNTSRKPDIICLKSAKSQASKENNWIVIGQIRRKVGLQGWLRVGLMTDFPDRFEPGEELFLKNKFDELESVIVSEWRPHLAEGSVDIRLEEVDDCDKAAAYVNMLVVIPKEEREEIDSDDEFYPDELEGMKVLSPKGEVCGTVIKMEVDTAYPYLLVLTEEFGEVMIPFRLNFVRAVSRKDKTLELVEPVSFHLPVE